MSSDSAASRPASRRRIGLLVLVALLLLWWGVCGRRKSSLPAAQRAAAPATAPASAPATAPASAPATTPAPPPAAAPHVTRQPVPAVQQPSETSAAAAHAATVPAVAEAPVTASEPAAAGARIAAAPAAQPPAAQPPVATQTAPAPAQPTPARPSENTQQSVRVANAATPPQPEFPTEITGTLALGVHQQSFRFASGSDIASASLTLVPVAFQQRITGTVAVDGYAAYASGIVKASGSVYTLNGPVDSWLRLRWAALRGVVLAAAVNLPTGVERHSASQAVVANALSNDLLGFREGNWGAGASGTFGISLAQAMGKGAVTFGASYRTDAAFQPEADTSVRYAPGPETRARLGYEMPFAAGSLSGGITFQKFGTDKLDRRNLFQSGNRFTGDLGYAHGAWSLYMDDLYRQNGDLVLPVTNIFDGTFLRDTTFTIGWQNLVVLGASTAMPLGRGFNIQPAAEFKLKNRQEHLGDGWIASGGATLPVAIGSTELFPSVKLTAGSIVPSSGLSGTRPLWGMEFTLIARRVHRSRIVPPVEPIIAPDDRHKK